MNWFVKKHLPFCGGGSVVVVVVVVVVVGVVVVGVVAVVEVVEISTEKINIKKHV